MLVHLPGILPPELIRQCRALLGEDAPWHDGRGSAGQFAGMAKQNMEIAQPSKHSDQLGAIVVKAIMASTAFQAAALPTRFSPPSFSRYRDGQSYGMHNDAAIMEFKVSGSRIFVRTDMAATLFLSQPSDYEGGELLINDTFGQSRIKLPAGDMILYPASSLHRVEPVTGGVRLVSFLWIQSLVPDERHRAILHELDMTLQGLNRTAPGDPAAARILNLYHNLLRLWSQT